MATQSLKQRTSKDEPTTGTSNGTTGTKPGTTTSSSKRDKNQKMAMAKRGLKSLSIAIAVPVALEFLSIYLTGSGRARSYAVLPAKPFWFPATWALHLFCLASSFLMGLSAWLVWAEGGFHKQPTGLPLFLTQLGLSLAWNPVVFVMGSTRLGLAACVAQLGVLVGCSRVFRQVNPIAGDLVKPCLAWVAFLCIVTYKLVYL